jgi:hypothetical protein
MEINLKEDTITVSMSKIIRMNEYFEIATPNGPIDVKAEIKVDLINVDEQYHEIVFNVLSSKYLNKVSFGHNPFSSCQPPKKKKWYQFWLKRKFAYI